MKKEQQEVESWISQYKVGYFKPLEMLASLTEEVGEIARELNHRFGPKKKKSTEDLKEVGDEISDAIFSLICIANSLDIDLDESWQKMLDKLNNRDKDRYEKK